MRKSMRKVLIGVLTSMLIIITMVATTYAWVGMLTYASVGQFDINLKVNDKNTDYSLLISPTGENGSFKENIGQSELDSVKTQILANMGYNTSYLTSSDSISSAFNSVSLTPVSPTISNGKINLNNFIELDINNKSFVKTNKLFKFDLYLSVDSTKGEVTADTTYLLDLYLSGLESSMVGYKTSGSVINKITYDNDFVSAIEYDSSIYKTISEIDHSTSIITDSSYSTRFAIEYYEGIPIDASYEDDEYKNYEPLRQTIYYNGTKYPLYNTVDGVYSFGNILSTNNNLAVLELNELYKIDLESAYNQYAKNNSLDNFDTILSARDNDLLMSSENEMLCDGIVYNEVLNPVKSKLTNYYEELYTKTSDTSISNDKRYYILNGDEYVEVGDQTISEIRNYYELSYVKTSDTEIITNKSYYTLIETSDIETLKLGIINGQKYKVKVSVYFWYEGWDADCFSIINDAITTLNLTFTSDFDYYE